MIITRITAGMGNQMFMYAAGLAVSQRLNTEFLLDLFGFDRPDVRKYMLWNFPNITERRAALKEIWALSPCEAIADYFKIRGNSIFKHPLRRLLFEVMSRSGFLDSGRAQRKPRGILAPVPFSRIYFPPNEKFSDEFKNIPDNVYMVGFYENEKFFADIKNLVREKFKFAPECFNEILTEKVSSCNSVALHVRKGDKNMSVDSYYKHALEKIFSLTSDAKIFVFSDDIIWCKENLPKIFHAEYNFIENQTAAQDMALMTKCKHVIISGLSTFSWWGAWLNENPNKIIVVPDIKFWFPELAKTISDFFPDDWLKID